MGLTVASGADALRAEGYRFVIDVEPEPIDFDGQGHLNNAATVRLFNDLRVAYVRGEVGSTWIDILQNDQLVVAARELHVLYESEGMPGESFVGAMRYLRREGKAARARGAARRARDRPGRRARVGAAAARAAGHGRRLARRVTSPGSPRSRAGRSPGCRAAPPSRGDRPTERACGQAPSSVSSSPSRSTARGTAAS